MDIELGVVEFERPRTANVYEKGKTKSCMVAAATVPAGPFVFQTAIWARMSQTAEGYDIEFEAAVPQRVSFTDEANRADFIEHIEESALAWSGYQAASDRAENTLLSASGEKARTRTSGRLAGRLVPKTVRTTAGNTPQGG